MDTKTLARSILDHGLTIFFVGNSAAGRLRSVQLYLQELAELCNGMVVRSPDTPSYLQRKAAVAFGTFSFGADPDTQEVVEHARLVVAVDNPLTAFATRDGQAFAGKTTVYVGDDPPQFPSVQPDHAVIGDPLRVLPELIGEVQRLLTVAYPQSGVVAMHPQSILRVLREELPPSSALFMDICVLMSLAGQEMCFGPGQTYEQCVEVTGTMCEAYGKSIGYRKAAPPEEAVACVLGDGGFEMSPLGACSSSTDSVPAGPVLILSANGGFQFVRQGLRLAVDCGSVPADIPVNDIPIGVHTESADYAGIGRLLCAEGYRCTNLAELRRHLRLAFKGDGPVVLEVPTHTEFKAPINDRAAGIGKLFGGRAGSVNGAERDV